MMVDNRIHGAKTDTFEPASIAGSREKPAQNGRRWNDEGWRCGIAEGRTVMFSV